MINSYLAMWPAGLQLHSRNLHSRRTSQLENSLPLDSWTSSSLNYFTFKLILIHCGARKAEALILGYISGSAKPKREFAASSTQGAGLVWSWHCHCGPYTVKGQDAKCRDVFGWTGTESDYRDSTDITSQRPQLTEKYESLWGFVGQRHWLH